MAVLQVQAPSDHYVSASYAAIFAPVLPFPAVLTSTFAALGGDGLLMACLWRAGYAVSDPGFSFYHPELRMFDPISQEGRQLLYAFTEGLSGGCDV